MVRLDRAQLERDQQRLTGAGEQQRHGHEHEGQHDPRAAHEPQGPQPGQGRGADEHEPDDARRRAKAPTGSSAMPSTAATDEHDLEARVGAVRGAVARDVAVELHGVEAAGRQSVGRVRRARTRPSSHIEPKRSTTPTRPATMSETGPSPRSGTL